MNKYKENDICEKHKVQVTGFDPNPFGQSAIMYECPACVYEKKIEHYKKASPTSKYLPVMEKKLKEILSGK